MRQAFAAAALAAALSALGAPGGHAEDVIKIGVVAAESGSFVSAGNTIPAAERAGHEGDQRRRRRRRSAARPTSSSSRYRDDRTDINTAIAAARELVNDVGVQAIFGTESHDFSIAMTKITGPAKVLQFTGNSSLGGS